MRKLLIAVCDTDGSYGEKLGEWISLQKGGRMQSVSFSSPEHFREYHSRRKQDIVLLGRGFADDPQMSGEILKGEVLWIYLHDRESEEPIPDYVRMLPSIEKYQSATGMLRDIYSAYQEWGGRTGEEAYGGREVIGVYSPVHSIRQTPFALTFAQAVAQKEKILYVNLQECAGFGGWFHEEYSKDLLDVMFLCLSNEADASHCVSSALYTMEGIDYIPPAEDGVCLGAVPEEDYLRFVRLLTEYSGYEAVMLDFGMMIPGFFKLLGMCSRVYIVSEPGDLQEAPLKQFQQMVSRQEDKELEQKLVYLSLPAAHMGTSQGVGKLQQWIWGTMGDFSRGLLGVQSGTD